MDEAYSFGPFAKNGEQNLNRKKVTDFRVKRTRKKKRNPPINNLSVDEDINL